MIAIEIMAEWLVSAIEVILYFLIVHTVEPEQFRGKKQNVLFFSIVVVGTTGIILLNLVDISFSLVTIVYGILAVSIGACILYKGSFLEFLFVAINYIAGINILEGFLVNLIAQIWSIKVVEQFQAGFSVLRLYVIIAFKCVEIPVALFTCFILKKVSLKLKASIKSLLCSMVGFSTSLYWLKLTDETMNLKLDRFQTILAVTCVFVCCSAYFYYRFREIQREQEYISRQNQLLEKNYQAAEESYESNARLYHDMRNHFSLIQNYLADGKVGEAQEYLEKISGSSSAGLIEQWTGIEAIDYILSQKTTAARQQGIKTDINAEYPKDCKIDPVDLCTILTNLLDNAIEACIKQPEEVEKMLSVTIRRIHQFIIIRITNTSTSAPVIRNGRFVTSKQDRQHHGWGMKSVKAAIEKYNGTMEYDYSDLLFTVSIMLFYQ